MKAMPRILEAGRESPLRRTEDSLIARAMNSALEESRRQSRIEIRLKDLLTRASEFSHALTRTLTALDDFSEKPLVPRGLRPGLDFMDDGVANLAQVTEPSLLADALSSARLEAAIERLYETRRRGRV